MAQVLYLKDTQDRKYMTKELEAEDYLFILKEFHRLLRRTLEPSEYMVFCAIEDHAGPGEQEDCPAYTCSASTVTLGEELDIGRTTVYRAILTLKENGLVTVKDREGKPSHIRPVVTSEARASYLLKGAGVNPTCINLIQDTYPIQNETGEGLRDMTRFKMKQPPVSNWNTKETKLKDINKTLSTNVLNGAEAPSPTDSEFVENEVETEQNQPEAASALTVPPPDSRGFYRRWREAYEAVQGDFKARSGVMGNLWTEVTGGKPDYKLLNRLAKDYNSMWVVCQGIIKMANCDVIDDPLVFLRKVLSNGNGTGTTRNDRGTGMGGPGSARPVAAHPAAPDPNHWNRDPAELDRETAAYRP
jgi:DNA-binding transcriptional ArsR family regulator